MDKKISSCLYMSIFLIMYMQAVQINKIDVHSQENEDYEVTMIDLQCNTIFQCTKTRENKTKDIAVQKAVSKDREKIFSGSKMVSELNKSSYEITFEASRAKKKWRSLREQYTNQNKKNIRS